MQVNPVYAHVGQRNQNGTQNISLYNPKTQSYQTITSSQKEVDKFVNSTNEKRLKTHVVTMFSAFLAGVEITALIKKFSQSSDKKNILAWTAVIGGALTACNFSDSYIYNKENENFINMHDAIKGMETVSDLL